MQNNMPSLADLYRKKKSSWSKSTDELIYTLTCRLYIYIYSHLTRDFTIYAIKDSASVRLSVCPWRSKLFKFPTSFFICKNWSYNLSSEYSQPTSVLFTYYVSYLQVFFIEVTSQKMLLNSIAHVVCNIKRDFFPNIYIYIHFKSSVFILR